LISTSSLAPRDPGRRAEHAGLALVLESEAFAIDADDYRVMEDPIEHRDSEYAVAGEGAVPAAEGEIRSEDHRAALVALRHDLEEQVGLLAAHRQVADLVDDQSPMMFIKNVHAPTLHVSGDRDAEVPITQSYEYWNALRRLGVKMEFVVYPDEGHSFFKRADQIDFMSRLVNWFNTYLMPGA
jgi:pimeloyl-ACP methyl ester carboxylesterase